MPEKKSNRSVWPSPHGRGLRLEEKAASGKETNNIVPSAVPDVNARCSLGGGVLLVVVRKLPCGPGEAERSSDDGGLLPELDAFTSSTLA